MNRSFVILSILVSIILIGCTEEKPNNESLSITKPTNPLTEIQKNEICDDINAYYDYCELNDIDINTCSTQAVEKVKRIYELSDNQLLEISDYCWE